MTSPSDCRFGFRIVGPTTGNRRCVVAGRAWEGYLSCAAEAEVYREAYLSAFTFGDDFQRHLADTGTTAGFSGACDAPFVWWDIDRAGDLTTAQVDAARLCVGLLDGFKLDEESVLMFASGGKGFHVGLPTSLWTPEPKIDFNRIVRTFAEHVAGKIGVPIDAGVYDKVRAFRAPNSRHPRAGLHKVRVTLDQLMHSSTEAVLDTAREPMPVEWEAPASTCDFAARLWDQCAQKCAEQARSRSRTGEGAAGGLNRLTLDFIRDGADAGERQTRLYSAAANLREHGAPETLAHALLSEPALDSGLPPGEVKRTIVCAYTAAPTAQEVAHG